MIKYRINRLFHGFASVRSTTIDKALLNREDLLINLQGIAENMLIKHEDIQRLGKRGFDAFYSKHRNEKYTLWDFEWKPNLSQQTLKLNK